MSPRSRRPVHQKLSALKADLLGSHRRLLAAHHGFVRFRVLRRTYTLVSEPEAVHRILVTNASSYRRGFQHGNLALGIGNGLLTSDGEVWQRQRRSTRPVFDRALLGRVVKIASAISSDVVDRWHAAGRRGETVDVLDDMRELSLRVISQAMFGEELPDQAGLFVATTRASLAVAFRRNIMPLSPPFWVPTRRHRNLRRCLAEVDRFVYARIADRLADDREHGDMLAGLIRAFGDRPDSMRELRDQIVTLYFAGFETTASALAWTLLMLGRNPEVADRLHAELVAVLGDRTPTYRDLAALPYTRQVLQESMRLHPPVYTLPRTAAADEQIGDIDLRQGDNVVVPIHVSHGSDTVWEKPAQSCPERFAPGRLTPQQRRAYLPFGVGPRKCIGESFAMATMMSVLAVVGRQVRLQMVDGHPVTPATEVTQYPGAGLPMHVRPAPPA
ncbi:cytochrome P450 [Micromonospora radicis]|uniref:Cytochrome P450 n=1 Tax=Micromonospora radicis TaxID=1894971 RepID=A0A418MP22_9ACTN|nr:cytochrome P450 [Micromonospora radicis]RIV33204.1 cytochrome P450 [Micromonospora radicis]